MRKVRTKKAVDTLCFENKRNDPLLRRRVNGPLRRYVTWSSGWVIVMERWTFTSRTWWAIMAVLMSTCTVCDERQDDTVPTGGIMDHNTPIWVWDMVIWMRAADSNTEGDQNPRPVWNRKYGCDYAEITNSMELVPIYASGVVRIKLGAERVRWKAEEHSQPATQLPSWTAVTATAEISSTAGVLLVTAPMRSKCRDWFWLTHKHD